MRYAHLWDCSFRLGRGRWYALPLIDLSWLETDGTAHGFGPIFSKPSVISDGTPVVVVFFQCVTSTIGPKATLALSMFPGRYRRLRLTSLDMPDFTRYAKKPREIFWSQPIGLVILVSLCGVLGATVTSATEIIYGKRTWNPLEVALLWENRAAQFFTALCWFVACVGTNISANSVSFSNDISLWFPKYIDSRRGAFICAFLSILSMPWYIQHSYVFAPFQDNPVLTTIAPRRFRHSSEDTPYSSAR